MKINHPFLVVFTPPGTTPSTSTKYIHKPTLEDAKTTGASLVSQAKGGSAVIFEAKDCCQVPAPQVIWSRPQVADVA